MHECMRLTNSRTKPSFVPDGDGGLIEDWRMRPSTLTPSKHWTGMVLGRCGGPSNDIQICGGVTGPEIHASRDLKDTNEEAFEWLMRFIRSENVEVTIDPYQCRVCGGHKDCIGGI